MGERLFLTWWRKLLVLKISMIAATMSTLQHDLRQLEAIYSPSKCNMFLKVRSTRKMTGGLVSGPRCCITLSLRKMEQTLTNKTYLQQPHTLASHTNRMGTTATQRLFVDTCVHVVCSISSPTVDWWLWQQWQSCLKLSLKMQEMFEKKYLASI